MYVSNFGALHEGFLEPLYLFKPSTKTLKYGVSKWVFLMEKQNTLPTICRQNIRTII
jgi:hypothetical protein